MEGEIHAWEGVPLEEALVGGKPVFLSDCQFTLTGDELMTKLEHSVGKNYSAPGSVCFTNNMLKAIAHGVYSGTPISCPVINNESLGGHVPPLLKSYIPTRNKLVQGAYGMVASKGAISTAHLDPLPVVFEVKSGSKLWIMAHYEDFGDDSNWADTLPDPALNRSFPTLTYALVVPGNVLYIPGPYVHTVITIEDCIAISTSFLHPLCLERFTSYVLGGMNPGFFSDGGGARDSYDRSLWIQVLAPIWKDTKKKEGGDGHTLSRVHLEAWLNCVRCVRQDYNRILLSLEGRVHVSRLSAIISKVVCVEGEMTDLLNKII
jgi:hypothetical protein